MMKKWSYIAAVIAALVLAFWCADSAQAKYVESKSLNLTLSIEKHYEVAFDANGGTGTMANQRFTYGEAQALTANTYTNEGSFFAGWNTSADGNGTLYSDGAMVNDDLTDIGGDVVTLYAQWEEDSMHTVFQIDGTCVFHGYQLMADVEGDGYITGTNCVAQGVDWADGTHRYINTGIQLYNSTNYLKDYEVGFTITEYDSDHQYKSSTDTASQVAFFNTKLEDAGRHWPGLVVRKNNDKIDITETIKKSNTNYEKKTASTNKTTPVNIVISRIDGIVYYSVNGGAFTQLQNMNGTTDYFDTDAWFGAAADGSNLPMRFVDATMTNMYVKIGDTGANKHTVSFDAGDIVADPSDVTILSSRPMGNSMPSMPSYVDTANGRLYFIGWYTGLDGAGEKYDDTTVISRDVTLHAFWNDELIRCSVGGETHGSLQVCVDAAGAGDTITLLEDLREQFTIAAGQEVILDLNGHTLRDSNVAGQPVIANNGKLTVINGTITSAIQAGVLNNNSTGEMHIWNGARIIATGTRQAIYNDGGRLEIDGDAYLRAATDQRAAVQNRANGTVVIKGGTIISAGREAVQVENGTAIIGVEDGVANGDSPILQGATYGINTSVNISMYDGVLRGETAAINNASRITATEAGATSVGIDTTVTEIIDGITYKIVYFQ